jgi:hypothetical protein
MILEMLLEDYSNDAYPIDRIIQISFHTKCRKENIQMTDMMEASEFLSGR